MMNTPAALWARGHALGKFNTELSMFSREQADSPRNIARVPTGAAGDREIEFPIGQARAPTSSGRAVLARADYRVSYRGICKPAPVAASHCAISSRMPIALLTPWSWILPTAFQIPEFIRGYIDLIDTEVLQSVLQSIGIFLIFVMVIIVLRRVRNLYNEVAALQAHVQQLSMNEQKRSLTDFRARRQTAPDDSFANNSAETALKLAVTEVELKALRDMVIELRQAREDWKAQAGHLVLAAAPITARAPADTPSALASAPTAAPEPERPTS
jgi:hypothetical protein